MEKKEMTAEDKVVIESGKTADVQAASEKEAATDAKNVPEKETAAGIQSASEKETVTEDQAAVEKEKADVKKEAVPDVYLQYREYEVNMAAVTDRVKTHYYAKGHQEGSIEDMQVYIKPEDFTAYYVINDGIVGKVNLF